MVTFINLIFNLKNFELLKKRIQKSEGFKNKPYFDQLGNSTIGYGHLIKSVEKHTLNKKQPKNYLTSIFEKDFKIAHNNYNKNYKKFNYNKNISEVLIEMIFQLGINKQKKFKKMNKHIKQNNLFMAALEMKNSLWYAQTPKRVNRLTKILLHKK